MTKPKEDAEPQETISADIKPCFIITPIGELNSPINLKAKGLINSVIEPVLREFGFDAIPAYKMADSGSINRQVLKSIISNELVIANLTGLNPNVMYELAVRHAVRLPVIIMAEDDTKLPFDINDQRTIFYSDTLLGSEIAKPSLRAAIEAVLRSKEEPVDNPIYQVYEEISVIKSSKGKEQSIDEYLLKRFDRLENAITRLSNNGEKSISTTLNKGVEITLKAKTTAALLNGHNELFKIFEKVGIQVDSITTSAKGIFLVRVGINSVIYPSLIRDLLKEYPQFEYLNMYVI
ncbi:MAG: hypothetical protein JWQ34_1258 [Mucilaginibacter sp.]|uniref:hypothetical protein n=1 Tax=Mucilaginibacter sp. TaxID=1882438 RepID=UPI00260A89D5|nr:hypothetical protein [Mucilaginibacter sp.]MDB5003033.1 hypothetical protein [Mucilaginibacter sp.]